MTLYEMNQTAYMRQPQLTSKEIDKAKLKVYDFIYANGIEYFMLLCNELKYYTIFDLKVATHTTIDEMVEELFDIVNELGTLRGIEVYDQRIEFWIYKYDRCHAYLLFSYDEGVIKFDA